VKTIVLLLALICGASALWAQTPGMPDNLTLGPQDQIEVNVTSYPDLKTVTRIAPDGNVVLPLIGAVAVGGLTPAAAAHVIEGRYATGGYIKAPAVRIEITDYQSRKASVLGEVNAQGLIVLDRNYSVAEILAKAGGLGPNAADTAVIVRQKPGGVSERISIDIGELVGTGGAGALTRVEPGDVVFVSKAPTFSVIGAVNRPGTYPLHKGITVDQGLAAAGDVNAYGSRSKLKIRRAPAEGAATIVLPAKIDDPLQPGDIVVVGERVF